MSQQKTLYDKIIIFLAEYLGSLLIFLLGKTLSVKSYKQYNRDKIKTNVIYAFWHNRMVILTYTHRNLGINVLVSQHRDGELIARVLNRLGFTTSRGSTTRGGLRALYKMINQIKKTNIDVALTPDGPRGPKYNAQIGAILLAQKTGLPIIPVANISNKKWVLNSWDNFIIPKPFSKAIIEFGEPIYVSMDDDRKSKLEDLNNKLNKLTQRVDNYFSNE